MDFFDGFLGELRKKFRKFGFRRTESLDGVVGGMKVIGQKKRRVLRELMENNENL